MRVWRVSASVQLALMVLLSGSLASVLALPGKASTPSQPSPLSFPPLQGGIEGGETVSQLMTSIPQLSELDQPATTVKDWLAQIEASRVQIAGVRVEETETGLQIVLETANGSLEIPETRIVGNALILEIANATIAQELSQANPIKGIALVSVAQLPSEQVRERLRGQMRRLWLR